MTRLWHWFRRGPLTGVALLVGHFFLLGLGRTRRVRHVGATAVDGLRADGCAPFYVFSHGFLLPLAFTHRHRDIRVLISLSRDGEILSRVTERLGFRTVRGSSTRGGREALVEMCRQVRAGFDAGLTPDGPKGPRGSVSPGAVVIARRESVPLVPLAVGADRAWRLKSWDRFLVPKPGARVWVVCGAPHRVATSDAEASVEAECRRLEHAIAATENLADVYASGTVTPSDVRKGPG